jgi:hypothetical protein
MLKVTSGSTCNVEGSTAGPAKPGAPRLATIRPVQASPLRFPPRR